MEIKFSITAAIHSSGEAKLSIEEGGEESIFVTAPVISPFVTLISGDQLAPQDRDRLKMMILHSLIKATLEKLEAMGMRADATVPINMTPTTGEQN